MTTTIKRHLNLIQASKSNNSLFTGSFKKFAANAISTAAQKQLKGGDGDGDILIEDMIGG